MKTFLRISLLLFLFSACSDKDDDITEPEPALPVKTCHLAKMVIPGQVDVLFTYNSAGYVIKRDVVFKDSIETERHEYSYNAQNQLITDKFFINGTLEYQKEFQYSNGLLTKNITTEHGNVREYQYLYDSNQRLIEVKSIDPVADYKSLYEYDANQNLTRIASYSYNQLSYESTYSNYDNKPNVYATLTGVHIPDNMHDLVSLRMLMKNNPGTVKHVFYSQLSSGGVQPITDALDMYTYSYRADGLVLTIDLKNKNGIVQIVNVGYNCN